MFGASFVSSVVFFVPVTIFFVLGLNSFAYSFLGGGVVVSCIFAGRVFALPVRLYL